MQKLTEEQIEVVHHPEDCHARVLAVAGSGKSTTLAYRIKHLIENKHCAPTNIQVLMFNSLARKQFCKTLDKVGLSQNLQPSVNTFHSFSFQVIHEAIKLGYLAPKTQFWLSDKSEFIWMSIKRIISDMEKARQILPESVDPEQVLHAIGLWKSSLIPPEQAGSLTQPILPIVYGKFETYRHSKDAITYDDFIPIAISMLENHPSIYNLFCSNLEHLFIDEYQDTNLGQQTLLEMMANERTSIMIIGDDDQCIYEWRGARPNFIMVDFAQIFNNKPVLDYRLSRSFRFGPIIAQSAANVIACNLNRVDKPLIAFQVAKPGFIHIMNGGYESIKGLADQVQALTQKEQVPASEIVVLSRMYAQMDNLEAEFLERKIPYWVEGQQPFFKRKEINTLLNYIRFTSRLNSRIDRESSDLMLSIINKPTRMISRNVTEKLLNKAFTQSLTPYEMLKQTTIPWCNDLSSWQCSVFQGFFQFLQSLQLRLKDPDASEVMSWMVKELDYLAYFQNYYGRGENADEKSHAVLHFIQYVKNLKITPLVLIEQLKDLDTTQGESEDKQIRFTTIFRTKGLEFDFVLLPQCDENLLPYLKGEQMDYFDKSCITKNHVMSSAVDNERRLFYVGLTRARKGVFIGTGSTPSRFLQEMQINKTETVMSAIQSIAAGNSEGENLLESTLQHLSLPTVIQNNLISGYLADMKLKITI